MAPGAASDPEEVPGLKGVHIGWGWVVVEVLDVEAET
jgi:hypothetical protein